MDSFEWNKIAGAVLMTALIVMALTNIADAIFAVPEANKNAYIVEGVIEEGASPTPAVAEVEPPIEDLLASASLSNGEKVAKKCLSCHSFSEGGAHGIGPALFGIGGRAKASFAEFSYSTALAELGGVWDVESLNAFLKSPKRYVAGTKMAFVGLRKAKDRADMIAYLQSLKN